jgi:hypothetical protein
MIVVEKVAVCPLTLAGAAVAEVKVPPIRPQMQALFPRGGQRGTEVAMTINLEQRGILSMKIAEGSRVSFLG